jgi:hypothetical protein
MHDSINAHLWRHPARVCDALDLHAGVAAAEPLREAKVANLDLTHTAGGSATEAA